MKKLKHRAIPQRLYVKAPVKSDMVPSITKDHEVVGGVVQGVTVDMVDNVTICQGKEFGYHITGYPLTLAAGNILPGLACLEVGVMTFVGAEMAFLASYPSPVPDEFLPAARTADRHGLIVNLSTSLLDEFVDVLARDAVLGSQFNHRGEFAVPIDNVNLVLCSEFAHV